MYSDASVLNLFLFLRVGKVLCSKLVIVPSILSGTMLFKLL